MGWECLTSMKPHPIAQRTFSYEIIYETLDSLQFEPVEVESQRFAPPRALGSRA